MSECIIEAAQSVPVSIGGFTLFTEKFRIILSKAVSERGTVSEGLVYTAKHLKSTRIILEGRAYGRDEVPFAMLADTLIRSSGIVDIEYKNILCSSCQLISFDETDETGDFVNIKMTLITKSAIQEAVVNAV